MHYAEFAEDEVSSFVRLTATTKMGTHKLTFPQSAALLQAIKDYENNKWKVIGQKVGKPAKVRMSLKSFGIDMRLDSISAHRQPTNLRRIWLRGDPAQQ